MPIIKITKRAVDALQAAARPFVAFDADLAGFGVRVMPTGVKSFVVEYRPHGGGRGVAKRRLTIGKVGALTPDQARRAASEVLAKVRLGADPAAEKAERRQALTVAALIDAFVSEHVEAKLKAKTGDSYAAGLSRLRDAHGSQKAETVSRAQLATLHAKMRTTPYAANRALAAWSKLFAWAIGRGLIPEGHNPARGIERYREQGRERFLTSEELARIGKALAQAEREGLPYDVDETKAKSRHAAKAENRRVRLDPFAIAAIRLLILTGARVGEILGAKWSEVDLERGVIFLADSKTGRKPIYLSAAAQAVLADLPQIEGNPYLIAGARDASPLTNPAEGESAATSAKREGAPRADLKRPWAAVCRAARLEGVRLHDLRHSFASVGAGASLGLHIIGKLLGHSQSATTARYAHLDADPLRRAVETIGTTIAAAMQGRPGARLTPSDRGSNGVKRMAARDGE